MVAFLLWIEIFVYQTIQNSKCKGKKYQKTKEERKIVFLSIKKSANLVDSSKHRTGDWIPKYWIKSIFKIKNVIKFDKN